MATVHSLFDGRSDDIELDVLFPEGPPTAVVGDGVLETGNYLATVVKEALADHYDRPLEEFSSYEVVVEPAGDITVRPPAKFGK